jgi:hypothetical protein
MKNSYLSPTALGNAMQWVSGAKGKESEKMEDANMNSIIFGLKGLMHHKYADAILLCTVTAAFGMLLAVSALS